MTRGFTLPRRRGHLYLNIRPQSGEITVGNNSLATYFPSMMSKFASHTGNAPHPTTQSVGVAAPLRTNSSKMSTIDGLTSGLEGSTVKTL